MKGTAGLLVTVQCVRPPQRHLCYCTMHILADKPCTHRQGTRKSAPCGRSTAAPRTRQALEASRTFPKSWSRQRCAHPRTTPQAQLPAHRPVVDGGAVQRGHCQHPQLHPEARQVPCDAPRRRACQPQVFCTKPGLAHLMLALQTGLCRAQLNPAIFLVQKAATAATSTVQSTSPTGGPQWNRPRQSVDESDCREQCSAAASSAQHRAEKKLCNSHRNRTNRRQRTSSARTAASPPPAAAATAPQTRPPPALR